jgi:hypothetical protein
MATTLKNHNINKAIVGLGSGVAKLNEKISKATAQKHALQQKRAELIGLCADHLLPSIKPAFGERLKKFMPEFFTPDVAAVFDKPTGLSKLIAFFVNTRDAEADLRMLRLKLRASIDGMVIGQLHTLMTNFIQFSVLHELIQTNHELAKINITELVTARSKLLEQLDKLQAVNKMSMHGTLVKVTKQLQPQPQIITEVRYQDDDVSSLMTNLLWINALTSSYQPAPAVTEAFVGGGGTFAGGGAAGSWDSSPTTDSALSSSPIIATDDSLGKFS